MPELPEVETTKRGIEPYLTDKNFKSIEIRNNKLRIPFNVEFLDFITKKKITEINRRAKYITIEFSNGYSLLIHLGMTGNLRVTKSENFQKHDHLIFKLSSGNSLVFNDVRRFGLAQIFKKEDGFYLLDNNDLILSKIRLLTNTFIIRYEHRQLVSNPFYLIIKLFQESGIYMRQKFFLVQVSPL